MEFKEITQTTKTGLAVTFRSAEPEEAQIEIDYLKRVCGETPFLLSDADEVNYTEEGEAAYLQNIKGDPRGLMLNAYVGGEMIGNGSFSAVSGARRLRHRCSVGIALFKDFCNQGIGELLLSHLIDCAREAGYEQVELDVYAINVRAIHLYEKLGFVRTGVVPHAVKYRDGSYTDLVLMAKSLQ